MTREEHLKFCQTCMNQKFDLQQGVICGLTNKLADFEDVCNSYKEDKQLKERYESSRIEREILTKTAGQGKRLVNYLIDSIFLFIIGFIIGTVTPSSMSIFEYNNLLLGYFLGLIIGMIYYVNMEVATGKTIGKYITKTKVVNEKGEKPDFGTILLRSFCRFIPFEPLSFLKSDSSGWHDKFSRTIVVENEYTTYDRNQV